MYKLWNKLTFWIDRTPSRVTFVTRLIAYGIDWFIGGIVAGFPAVFIYALITGKSDMLSDLYVFPALGYPKYWSYISCILCIVLAFFYFVYVPLKIFPGQTLGKKWLHIKIMRIDGKELDLKTLIIRQMIGMMLIEGVSIAITNYIRQVLTLITGFYVEYYLLAIASLLTVISAVLVFNTPSRRSIHDYMAKTRVAMETEVYQEPKNKKNKH